MAVITDMWLGLSQDDNGVTAPCGCELRRVGVKGEAAVFTYCCVHGAAMIMLKALKRVWPILVGSRYGKDFDPEYRGSGKWNACEAARTAINAAEGKKEG